MGKTKSHKPHSNSAPLGGSRFSSAQVAPITPSYADPDHDGDNDQSMPDNDNDRER